MSDSLRICCDEFESAVATTFANPIDSPSGWLLYGTDYESVSAGHPELRYWPIRHCPFCGAGLDLPPRDLLRRSRRFGFDAPPEGGGTDDRGTGADADTADTADTADDA